jgi:membrane protein DedA with SNARE-associated domain
VPALRVGLLTAAGSLIWDGGMAAIGYGVGARWRTVMHGFSYAGYLIAAICLLLLAVAIVHRYRAYKMAEAEPRGSAEEPLRRRQLL